MSAHSSIINENNSDPIHLLKIFNDKIAELRSFLENKYFLSTQQIAQKLNIPQDIYLIKCQNLVKFLNELANKINVDIKSKKPSVRDNIIEFISQFNKTVNLIVNNQKPEENWQQLAILEEKALLCRDTPFSPPGNGIVLSLGGLIMGILIGTVAAMLIVAVVTCPLFFPLSYATTLMIVNIAASIGAVAGGIVGCVLGIIRGIYDTYEVETESAYNNVGSQFKFFSQNKVIASDKVEVEINPQELLPSELPSTSLLMYTF